MPFELVIFDCDGVLIDSEVIVCRIEAEELRAIGYSYNAAAIVRRFSGIPSAAMYEMMEAESGIPIPSEVRQRVRGRIREAMETELAVIPGAREALAGIAGPVCVASSSGLDYLEWALGLVGLWRRFHPHVFSAQQVARGKPAPDLFLHAAERMRVRPEACVVVEDSPAGVRAGLAAGMRVIGFAGGSHCPGGHGRRLMDEGALQTLWSLRLLPAFLRLL
jgi:HAD superfamily hydrolase (TIGR01509 family)